MKAVIFDFDGTIADNFRFVHTIVSELAPKYGFPQEVAAEVVGMRSSSMREIVKKYHISRFNLFRMLLDGRKEMKKLLGKVEMPSGLADLIKARLADGHKVAIISSNSKTSIVGFLKQNGISGGVEVESSIHLFGKSSAIRKYLKKNKINKSDAVYIGDEVRDIDAAREAGIKCISVTWGYNTKEVLEKNNQLLTNSVAELELQIKNVLK